MSCNVDECKPLVLGGERLHVSAAPGRSFEHMTGAQSLFRPRLPGVPGRAVQVDPVKPTLAAPETRRMLLTYDVLPSCYAFNVNLRRYTLCCSRASVRRSSPG